jgi:hypothetical protein
MDDGGHDDIVLRQLREGYALENNLALKVREALATTYVLEPHLSGAALSSLMRAHTIAAEFNHQQVTVYHFLIGLVADGPAAEALTNTGCKLDGIRKLCASNIAEFKCSEFKPSPLDLQIAFDLKLWMNAAHSSAKKRRPENRHIEPEDFVQAIYTHADDEAAPKWPEAQQHIASIIAEKPPKTIPELLADSVSEIKKSLHELRDEEMKPFRNDVNELFRDLRDITIVPNFRDLRDTHITPFRNETTKRFNSVDYKIRKLQKTTVRGHRRLGKSQLRSFKKTRSGVDTHRIETASGFKFATDLAITHYTSLKSDTAPTAAMMSALHAQRVPSALLACVLLCAIALGGGAGFLLKP